jgi:GNAT superfamily N-acetyltransferase
MKIIDYEPRYQGDFKRLNVQWIQMHWQLEAADHHALDHPYEHIITPGGHIFLALDDGEVVGTCALIRLSDTKYELAKMAVDETMRGRGIGVALGNAVIDRARMLSAEKVYLESNTILEPAISLYRKLGFEEFAGDPSAYERCNIQMVLALVSSGLETPAGELKTPAGEAV